MILYGFLYDFIFNIYVYLFIFILWSTYSINFYIIVDNLLLKIKLLFLKYRILLILIRKITVYSFWQVPMTIIFQIKDFDTNMEGQFLFSDFIVLSLWAFYILSRNLFDLQVSMHKYEDSYQNMT